MGFFFGKPRLFQYQSIFFWLYGHIWLSHSNLSADGLAHSVWLRLHPRMRNHRMMHPQWGYALWRRDAANGSFPKPKLRFYAASGIAEVDVAKVQTDLRHCACLQLERAPDMVGCHFTNYWINKYAARATGDVFVITGPVYEPSISQSPSIGAGHVRVPKYLFKLVYDKDKNKAWAHWHLNDDATRASKPIS